MKQSLPFTDSKRAALGPTLKFILETVQTMRRSERLARRAEAHGAQNAAQQFYLEASMNAGAMEYWLGIAAQHAASGKALYQTL